MSCARTQSMHFKPNSFPRPSCAPLCTPSCFICCDLIASFRPVEKISKILPPSLHRQRMFERVCHAALVYHSTSITVIMTEFDCIGTPVEGPTLAEELHQGMWQGNFESAPQTLCCRRWCPPLQLSGTARCVASTWQGCE